MHGEGGKMIFGNGNVYEGGYVDNKKQTSFGTMTWKDGMKYEGEF